jgi:putative ABC transport system ATP-binding protein
MERWNLLLKFNSLITTLGKGVLRKPVLSDIDLSIYRGEVVILMGPSGSGKTTLLNLIGGLRSLQGGYLSVLGHPFKGAKKRQLRKVRSQIGFIFQDHHLLNCLTAQQNVMMSLKLHRHESVHEQRQRANTTPEAAGLGERIHYRPDSLSGGQKQRVAIARALVAQPKLVLADEPTAALDSHTGRAVVTLMQTFAKEQGCAVLMVTHDNRILDVADRIVQMEDERLRTDLDH